jgi:hypothetical protein
MRLKTFTLPVFFYLIIFLISFNTFAQNELDDIEEEDRSEQEASIVGAPNLVSETIQTVSPTRKIFILTNENDSFGKGDFISLLLENKLVCRALVAKTTPDKLSGIKIVKIYNLALWKKIEQGKEVLVLKGDDSYYSNAGKNTDKDQKDSKDKNKVQSEDDLFNSTSLTGNEDELSLEENNKRLIKTDNLLSLNVGMIQSYDVDGSKKNFTQLNAAWGYQINENIWAEACIGTNTVTGFPSSQIDTRLTNITVKGKYTFPAPFYSYFQPYVGYQTIMANSPGAGVDDSGNSTPTDLENELELVEKSRKSSIIYGVTILKRIVPGWFIRADLGTDIINGGLTLEF